MPVRRRRNLAYGIGDNLLALPPSPIVSQRAPTVLDRVEIGTIWVDEPNDDVYVMTSIVGGSGTWINAGGGTGTFNALTVTTTADIGTALTVGTTAIIGTTLTVSGLGEGVVQSSAAGLLSSSDGTDGQILIASTAGVPAWAVITPGAGINVTNAAGAITITATGAVASTFPTDAGIATPAAGATTIAGGTNINTAGAGATVTINLDASPTVAGSLTAGVDLTMTSGVFTVTGTTDAPQTIYLRENAGTAATIDIHSDQSTLVNSINVHSDVGGILLDSGIASADAINIIASNAAGGLDFDSGTAGIICDTTGSISLDSAADSNFTVTGAFDLSHISTLGSVILNGGEAVGDAVQLTASDAAGGITAAAGTGGITLGATNGIVAITSGTSAINIGIDATAHTVTVGSTNTTARTVIQSGTGDVAVTSTDAITIDSAGVLELNSSAGIIGIGNDAIAQNINVGTGAAARTITIGNITGATQLALNAGTGGIGLASTGAGDITINSDDTLLLDADGVLELNSSAGAIGIGNDADAQNINIGTGAAARIITLGNVTGATSVVIDAGTGAVNVGISATAHATTLGSTNTTSATTVQSGTGDLALTSTDAITVDCAGVLELNSTAGIIGIGSDADAQNINIGTGAAARVVTLGNITGATQLALNAGTGGIGLASTGAGDITLNSSDTVLIDAAGVLELNSTAGVIGIGSDADAQNINIGTGAAARTITIGNVTGATSVVVDGGTGAVSVGASATAHTTTLGSVNTTAATVVQSGTGDLALTSTDAITVDATGVLELNSTGGAIGIGSDADAQAINIGTGAAARTITVGNGTGATSVVVDCGTGALNIGTNAVARTTTIGNATGASAVAIDSGTGDITLTSTDDVVVNATGDCTVTAAGAVVVDAGADGDILLTPATNSAAGLTVVLNAKVGIATYTGQTTGSTAQATFVLTNNEIAATSGIIATVANIGGNDARMSLERVEPGAGTCNFMLQNNGAAALNGDVYISFMVMS